MIVVGERIHVISPRVKAAFEARDAKTIQQLALRQAEAGAHFIDLNIGPAKKTGAELMPWLVDVVQEVTDVPLSLDTTNGVAIEAGLQRCKKMAMLNSTSAQPARQETMLPLAAKYGTYLVALTLTEQGIPGDATGRADVAMQLLDAISAAGVPIENVFLDPLVLPVSADQCGCEVTIEAIRYFKQLADPAPKTIVGLSNVSNGSPNEIRPLINQVYTVLLMGAGLDAAIIDPNDEGMMETIRIVEQRDDSTPVGKLLVNLFDATAAMEELDPSVVDMSDPAQVDVYKTVRILTNKVLYAHSYLRV
jgi:5-methyltetrahydrofolate corrinoid/iron sulfur protein methyltransferase